VLDAGVAARPRTGDGGRIKNMRRLAAKNAEGAEKNAVHVAMFVIV